MQSPIRFTLRSKAFIPSGMKSSLYPIIFKQERVGRFGRPFYIYKFRSMRLDAESMGPQLIKKNLFILFLLLFIRTSYRKQYR